MSSSQYPYTQNRHHPLPNSIFFMLVVKASAPNQKLFPKPATANAAFIAEEIVQNVINHVVSHYAKVKKSQLKTHPLPSIPAIPITSNNISISDHVNFYNQVTAACLNYLNSKITHYISII